MAQWLGQFSGLTHESRVKDAEVALRHAVAVFRAATSAGSRRTGANIVRNLAGRLFSARARLPKARLAAIDPAATEDAERLGSSIAMLQEREARLHAEGTRGILAEFGAGDAES